MTSLAKTRAKKRAFHALLLVVPSYVALGQAQPQTTPQAASQLTPAVRVNKTTYHYNMQRTGWNNQETILTPSTVASKDFGLLWESPQLDGYQGREPRLMASPLYLDSVTMNGGAYVGQTFSVAYLASTTGYVYAVNTAQAGNIAPGTILWRTQVAATPCGNDVEMIGVLSTPIIDLEQNRIYVSSCNAGQWQVHALDVRSGQALPNWPLGIVAKNINRKGVIKNGVAFPSEVDAKRGAGWWNRGALNLSPDKGRLYISFGKDGQPGWLISVDTRNAKVASAFATTNKAEEIQGGMWSAGGPVIDPQGRVYITTGASYELAVVRGLGFNAVFEKSSRSWGQSILQLRDDPRTGFELTGTYTPFNYCHNVAKDIDLGASSPIVIDVPGAPVNTPHLLALGGAKQGMFYLLNRDKMPGSLDRRPPCTYDSTTDKSLLDPDGQPHYKGARGPINLFPEYSEDSGMVNSAKSRSTAAFFADDEGNHWVFATGSSKTGEGLGTPVPPGVAKVRLFSSPDRSTYPKLDSREYTQLLYNPGSPVITSNGGKDAVLWVMDPNALRSALLYGPNAPRPTLYAFDAKTLRLLWKTGPDDLFTSGKYNEPAVVNGLVLVGTDRLQAFGRRPDGFPFRAARSSAGVATQLAAAKPRSPGQVLYETRCAGCHAGGETRAPTRQVQAAMSHDRIVTAMTSGPMMAMAAGLTQEQIQQIAIYIKTGSGK